MSRYEIIFEGRLVSTTGELLSREDAESSVDLFVEELEKIDVEDIDVSTNLANCTVTVSVSTEATDMLEAQIAGSGTIRTAFHAAEVATPGWSINWTRAETIPEVDYQPELAST